MKKRILALLLSVVLLGTLFVQALPTALAADVVDSGSCGENVTWTLDSDGVLTISGEGIMFYYDGDNVPWAKFRSKIKTAAVEDGVTYICSFAFYGCLKLTGVTLPDSITGIGSNAFEDCTALKSITIPDGVTEVPSRFCTGCSSLSSVTIPDSVTCIGIRAFSGCTGLTSISIPDSVASIGEGAFEDCTSLTDINIPDGVTEIDTRTFYGCTGLTSISVPDSVASIGAGAFEDCTGLTDINIPDGVTEIDARTFYGCSALTSITIPDSVVSIDTSAFDGCSGLTSVIIPDSVTKIEGYTFYGCTGLTSISIPDSVASIGVATFYGCSGLTSISIPNGMTTISEITFKGCTGLTSVTIPDSVTSIGASAFFDCAGLSGVCFKGDAPKIDSWPFPPNATLYYIEGKSGWTSPTWSEYDYKTALWDGVNLPQPPHEHSYTAVVTAPTCTEQGYTTHTCTCGDSYKDSYVSALGHSWDGGKVTTAPTAEKEGVKTYTCTRCGATKTEVIAKLSPVTVSFGDVDKNAYYAEAVNWAVAMNVTNGVSDTSFAPNDTCTRGQIVTFLWRAAGKPTPTGRTNPFTDVSESDYYYDAVLWAVENNITAGTSATTFSPNDGCTRGQVATFLWRYEGKPTAKTSNPFVDVKQGAYYYDAVLWAVENGITNGTSATTFEPDATCTRGQIVTFLYRDIAE